MSSGRPPIRSVTAPAIGATIIGMPVHGSIRRPASSGEFPCTFWRYWVRRKIDPNMPKNMRSDAAFAAANARFRKKRIGSIGSRVRRSQATKRDEEHDARDQRGHDLRARPAARVGPDEAPHEAERGGGDEPDAGHVEPRLRAVALAQPRHAQRDRHEADRDVEPEDPLPREALDDRAAHERAERDSEAGDAAPQAEREPAPLGRDGVAQDGQGERRHDRAADALKRAGADQPLDRRRQCRRRRAEREDAQADEEDPLPAEAVAQGGAEHQEHGEGQRVGVHGPLEARDGRVQVALHRRQRGCDDEVVERRHEERDRGDRECPDDVSPVAHAILLRW